MVMVDHSLHRGSPGYFTCGITRLMDQGIEGRDMDNPMQVMKGGGTGAILCSHAEDGGRVWQPEQT